MAQTPNVTNNSSQQQPQQSAELPYVGYNFLGIGSEQQASTLTTAAALPSTPMDINQARLAHDTFVAERLLSSQNVLSGAQGNLRETRKEQAANTWSATNLSSWFTGGLREELAKQEQAEQKFVAASEAKVAEFKKRADLSQQVMLTAQQLTQQAQQLEQSGNAARAGELRTFASQLLEIHPAVLDAPTDKFQTLAPRLERTLADLASGSAATARESLALCRGMSSEWQRTIDTRTGERPHASAIADTKDLQQSYRSINENIGKNFVNANRIEYVVITGVVIAVGATAATVATGGLALPAILGGATIGTGLVGGTILGVAAGTAVGAAAAYGEAVGNLRYGKSWDEVSGKAKEDLKSHFVTALTSVGFGRVAQGFGWAVGKTGVVGKFLLSPFSGAAKVIPTPIRRMFTYSTAVAATAIPAGATSAVMTVGDGIYTQLKADEKFQDWAHSQPHLDPSKKDFDSKAYHEAWLVFREANHVTPSDVLWQAGRNAIISGFSAAAHAGPQTQRTFAGSVARHGAGLGVGVGTEFVMDKFRESVNHEPLGKPMKMINGNEVDEADAMGITWAHLWGSIMGRAQNRAYFGPPGAR